MNSKHVLAKQEKTPADKHPQEMFQEFQMYLEHTKVSKNHQEDMRFSSHTRGRTEKVETFVASRRGFTLKQVFFTNYEKES